jgi:hypothetical protein
MTTSFVIMVVSLSYPFLASQWRKSSLYHRDSYQFFAVMVPTPSPPGQGGGWPQSACCAVYDGSVAGGKEGEWDVLRWG